MNSHFLGTVVTVLLLLSVLAYYGLPPSNQQLYDRYRVVRSQCLYPQTAGYRSPNACAEYLSLADDLYQRGFNPE